MCQYFCYFEFAFFLVWSLCFILYFSTYRCFSCSCFFDFFLVVLLSCVKGLYSFPVFLTELLQCGRGQERRIHISKRVNLEIECSGSIMASDGSNSLLSSSPKL